MLVFLTHNVMFLLLLLLLFIYSFLLLLFFLLFLVPSLSHPPCLVSLLSISHHIPHPFSQLDKISHLRLQYFTAPQLLHFLPFFASMQWQNSLVSRCKPLMWGVRRMFFFFVRRQDVWEKGYFMWWWWWWWWRWRWYWTVCYCMRIVWFGLNWI